jgi:tripartite-type tricarboxylate transporter receptor subunit TctC
MTTRRTFLGGTAATLAALHAGPARAQAYPSRPVTIVVPYAAGGGTDIVARLVGQQLQERLGQPVVIENKPGATTAIGTQFVARAAPDGHTLLLTAPPFVIGRYATPKPPYDSVTDFAPICLATTSPLIVAVAPKLPVSTFADFQTYARANEGKLNYGSTGIMGLPHLAAEILAKRANLAMAHVPYRGGGQVVTDLLSGQVDMYLGNPLEVAPHFAAGVKGLAVTSKDRSPLLPTIPSAAESGIADFDLITWTGFFAPAATPTPVVAKLNAEISAILMTPGIGKNLNEQFSSPVGGSIAAFQDFLQNQHRLFADVVKSI